MKAKCPNCKTDLRYVQSIKSLLCNDCGFSLVVDDEPEAIAANEPKPPTPAQQKQAETISAIIYLGCFVFAIVFATRFMTAYQKSANEYQQIQNNLQNSITELNETKRRLENR